MKRRPDRLRTPPGLQLSAAGVSRAAGMATTVLALQACCCGTVSNVEVTGGPPGIISGRILPPAGAGSSAASVYAVDDSFGAPDFSPNYLVSRVAVGGNYSVSVPAGQYRLVARLDSNLLQFGGYTSNVANGIHNPNPQLVEVVVAPAADMTGLDIGDWGSNESQVLGWTIDVRGRPVPGPSEATPPTPRIQRSMPDGSNVRLSSTFVRTPFGVHFLLPEGWSEVQPPKPFPGGAFFSNEAVSSPISLDDHGLWLSLWNAAACPGTDARYVTATTSLGTGTGLETFIFQGPATRAGPQPFVAYSVNGRPFAISRCVEFVLSATNSATLEAGLPLLAAVMGTAAYNDPA